MRFRFAVFSALLAGAIFFPGATSHGALAQTPFYQGKTITVIHGRNPGGTGDARVRPI